MKQKRNHRNVSVDVQPKRQKTERDLPRKRPISKSKSNSSSRSSLFSWSTNTNTNANANGVKNLSKINIEKDGRISYNLNGIVNTTFDDVRRIVIKDIPLKSLLLVDTNPYIEHIYIKIARFTKNYQNETNIYKELYASPFKDQIVPILANLEKIVGGPAVLTEANLKQQNWSRDNNRLILDLQIPISNNTFSHKLINISQLQIPIEEVFRNTSNTLRRTVTLSEILRMVFENKPLNVIATGNSSNYVTFAQLLYYILTKNNKSWDQRLPRYITSVICTLYCLHKHCTFVHGDLHIDNLFVDPSEKKKNSVTTELKIQDKSLYNIRLFDFDFSVTKHHPMGQYLINCNQFFSPSNLADNENGFKKLILTTYYGFLYDVFRFVTSILDNMIQIRFNHDESKLRSDNAKEYYSKYFTQPLLDDLNKQPLPSYIKEKIKHVIACVDENILFLYYHLHETRNCHIELIKDGKIKQTFDNSLFFLLGIHKLDTPNIELRFKPPSDGSKKYKKLKLQKWTRILSKSRPLSEKHKKTIFFIPFNTIPPSIYK